MDLIKSVLSIILAAFIGGAVRFGEVVVLGYSLDQPPLPFVQVLTAIGGVLAIFIWKIAPGEPVIGEEFHPASPRAQWGYVLLIATFAGALFGGIVLVEQFRPEQPTLSDWLAHMPFALGTAYLIALESFLLRLKLKPI